MGCIFSFFKFNQSYKVAEPSENKDSSQQQGKKASKKQQSGQQSNKSAVKNEHPPPNQQSFIYKTVLETTVADAKTIEEEERKKAEEAPGPFEIETDLLSPEVEEAVIKIQANVRGYLTRKQYRVTPERSIEKPSSQVNQEPVESSNDASSGILAPPPSFSDTPKELPLDDDNQTANQGKRIAEKLIELEKQVSQAIQPYDKKPAVNVDSRQLDDKKANSSNDDQSNSAKSNEDNSVGGNASNIKLLEIPSIETESSESSAPEEAATKIQAAFRGYQVRKTISRETSPSPLKSRDKTDDKDSELDADKEGKVHLRERLANSAQDPERESILVLDQLEEALSKELLNTPGKTEDETSSSSNSTDIDLNSSLKSNSSLIVFSESDSIQKVTSDNLTESQSKSNNIENKELQDSLSISNSSQSDDKSLTNNLEKDNLSISTTENTVYTESSKLIKANESPTVASDLKESEILDSSSVVNIVEKISEEPVVFVSSEDKVDASSKLESEESKEIDPVVMVEVAGKFNASHPSELTSDSKIDLGENINVESNILHEVQSYSNENNQPKNEPKLDSPISLETEEVHNQLVTKSKETTDSKVDQIPTCDKPNVLSKKEVDSLPQLIASNEPSSVQEREEIQIEPELISSKSAEPTAASPISNISLPDDPLNAIVKEKSSETKEPKFAEKSDDIKAEENVVSEDKDFKNEKQQSQKFTKEDSFGSDILILDDDSIDRSDTLYDIIAEKGLNVSQSSSQPNTQIFGSDNSEEKISDLLLHDQSNDPTVFSFVTDASESITEMKDDILVNLDESDEEDKKENNDQQSSISKATSQSDQLTSNEESNTSISNDSVSSHIIVEHSITSENSANDQISTSVKPTETSSETHVQLSEDFKQSDKDLNKEHLENDDIAVNETINKPINESIDKQIDSSNIESCIKESSSTSDDKLEKSDKNSAIVPDEHSNDRVSQENVRLNVDQVNPDTDLSLKEKPLGIEEKTSRDLLIESNKTAKVESTARETSPPRVEIINESEESSNKAEFIDQKSISQTPVTINVQPPTNTTAEVVQEKREENLNAAKDDKDNLITMDKNDSIDSLESQSQSKSVLDDSSTSKQTKESAISLHSESSKGLNLDESTCSSQSVLIINQPEIVESSVAPEPPASSTESTTNEESDDKTEDSNPEDENRLLRIVERDARSKSPNPFGRKRRKGKKGRGVQ